MDLDSLLAPAPKPEPEPEPEPQTVDMEASESIQDDFLMVKVQYQLCMRMMKEIEEEFK